MKRKNRPKEFRKLEEIKDKDNKQQTALKCFSANDKRLQGGEWGWLWSRTCTDISLHIPFNLKVWREISMKLPIHLPPLEKKGAKAGYKHKKVPAWSRKQMARKQNR